MQLRYIPWNGTASDTDSISLWTAGNVVPCIQASEDEILYLLELPCPKDDVWHGRRLGGSWWWSWGNHVGHPFSITGSRMLLNYILQQDAVCSLGWFNFGHLRRCSYSVASQKTTQRKALRAFILARYLGHLVLSRTTGNTPTYSHTDKNKSVMHGQMRCTRYGGKQFCNQL